MQLNLSSLQKLIDLAIIYESVFATADEAKKSEVPDPAA